MADDDYEILPHKEISDIKKQLDEMRGGPSPKKLQESIDELRKEIAALNELFTQATQQIQSGEKGEEAIHKKLDKIISQNKVIAEAMVTIAEKPHPLDEAEHPALPERKTEKKDIAPQSFASSFGQPDLQGNSPFAAPQPFSAPSPYSQAQSPPQPFAPPQGFGSPSQPSQRSPPPFTPPQPFGQQQGPTPIMPPPRFSQAFDFTPPQGASGAQPDFGDLPDLSDLDSEPKKKKGLFSAFRK